MGNNMRKAPSHVFDKSCVLHEFGIDTNHIVMFLKSLWTTYSSFLGVLVRHFVNSS